MITKEELEICEGLDWQVDDIGDGMVEISNYSPLDENLVFVVDCEGFSQKVQDIADTFDPDEHVKMWINNMSSVRGVPQSIRDLLEDAEDIKAMLEELAQALKGNFRWTQK